MNTLECDVNFHGQCQMSKHKHECYFSTVSIVMAKSLCHIKEAGFFLKKLQQLFYHPESHLEAE